MFTTRAPSPLQRRGFLVTGIVTVIAGLGLSGVACAQQRTFPPNTKVGRLELGNFPEALLDGKRVHLAPGVRILSTGNLVLTPMSITGPQRVRYRLDPLGQPDLIWILTEAEARDAANKTP